MISRKALQRKKSSRLNRAVFRGAEMIHCAHCGARLSISNFARAKIHIGGPRALRGAALQCRVCRAITCIECAMKLTAGQAEMCPACKTILGIAIYTGDPVGK
jgi:hypothetical protein